MDNDAGSPNYKVVINHEEQYSIWPAERESPAGWNEVGITGTKETCLAYINDVWVDMRPLSLRKRMDEAASSSRRRTGSATVAPDQAPDSATFPGHNE